MNTNLLGNLHQMNGRFALLVMLLFYVFGAKGQDYSGVYYIASRDWSEGNNTNNFYLCPTEEWAYYQSTSPYYYVFSQDCNTDTPFMTTYKCRSGLSYDAKNAVWIVEKHPTQNFYYIKRAIDGKYLTYNVAMEQGSNAGRMRVHLEESPADENDVLFGITYVTNNSCYEITTKKFDANTTRKYLNVTGPSGGNGNINSLQGTSDRSDGPSGCKNVGGIIGLYTAGASDPNGKWYLEPAAVEPPTITNNFDGTITITAASGATIYYTTNGTDPTTSSSVYSEPITLTDAITVVKAIAKASSDYLPSLVRTYRIPVCERPVITVSNSNATITCNTPNASIYYTTDGTPATASPTPYTGSFSTGDEDVIRAIATSSGYYKSNEAFYYLVVEEVSSSSEITNMNARYKLLDGFTSSASIGTAENPFRGVIDGNYVSFSLDDHALVGVAEDAVIKNIVVSSVNYNGSGNVGAIVNTAKGGTKIYNCGVLNGTVSGGTNTGGLVGLIEAGSSVRVVNCYNFANVNGSSYAAGIVGLNEGTVSDDGTVGNVRIALCMMYGNVTGASIISPVYCGNHVNNIKKFTEYNYWRYRSGLTYTPGHYNDQMAIDKDDYLTRFPFYCHILNTHRKMAAFFLFGGVECNNVGDISDDDIAEIGHWVLKKDIAPYPIIERWQTNTRKVLDADAVNIVNDEHLHSSLSVTVKIGTEGMASGSTAIETTISLPVTDMDEDNYDFTYGKVVLPFANEFRNSSNELWTPNYGKICTGWKVTSVSPASQEPFEHYNVSDRNCTTKDLYSTTGFIFAQGGNYIVPYGVTAITIEANFANAFYLCDESYEIGYEKDKSGSSASGYINRTILAGSTPGSFTVGANTYTIYHTLPNALDAMRASGTTHEQAIVLVGNYHIEDFNLDDESGRGAKGYTIMSIDADNNQEPDYAIYSNNTQDRPFVPPTRYDFVAFIPLGMSSHVNSAYFYPNTPIWKPRGWFEITETGLIWANQFEIDSGDFNTSEDDTRNYRCIINGGYFTQMVRSRKGACTKLKYYQLGGKVYVKEFYPGNHSANSYANTLVPINVTGGEIEQCFMTGYGQGTVYGPDIYFWCAGGKIGKFLGSYMEKPRQTNNSDGNVNMTAKIDHAIIGRFFGGGTTQKARITGDIDVTINNSRVDFYCGGPEFGDMSQGKKVTTHAFNTTFGEYYGAGFGGTAITYRNDKDDPNVTLGASVIYPDYFTTFYVDNTNHQGRLHYLNNYGLGNCYKFEFIMHSRGHRGVARFYTGFAMFSLATTGSVENVLDSCTVLKNFFGAGCQGKVNGTVTSTLTDCTVLGSAYGGGYKATANEVEVFPTTAPTRSIFTGETGIFSDFGTVEPEIYTWQQGKADPYPHDTAYQDQKYLYTGTDVILSDLGNVTDNIKITLDGKTTVMGSVFGGGYESKSLSNTEVQIYDRTRVFGNIYGGGNMGKVSGNTKVIINGTVPDETPNGNANNNNPNH